MRAEEGQASTLQYASFLPYGMRHQLQWRSAWGISQQSRFLPMGSFSPAILR